MMFRKPKKDPDIFEIQCPLCGTRRSLQKSKIKNFEMRKAIRFNCTCGTSFQQNIRKEAETATDFASLLAMDIKELWFKIKMPFSMP